MKWLNEWYTYSAIKLILKKTHVVFTRRIFWLLTFCIFMSKPYFNKKYFFFFCGNSKKVIDYKVQNSFSWWLVLAIKVLLRLWLPFHILWEAWTIGLEMIEEAYLIVESVLNYYNSINCCNPVVLSVKYGEIMID